MEFSENERPFPEHPTLSQPFLDGVRDHDPAQWSRLVTTYGPIVYRWCRTSGISECDAPDVVQEIFSSVARGIGNFERQKESGSFRSWLATISRNRVRDFFRRQAKHLRGEGGTEAMQRLQQRADSLDHLIDESIDGSTISSPLVQQVMKSVEAEFEPSTWQAFWLTTIESQTASSVAATTGLSLASVYQSKSRVLRKLRQRMSELPT